MNTPVGGVDPLRVLQGITDRQGGGRQRGDADAFRRALAEGGREQEPGQEDGQQRPAGGRPAARQPTVPRGLQARAPVIRRDPADGSLHVDCLA